MQYRVVRVSRPQDFTGTINHLGLPSSLCALADIPTSAGFTSQGGIYRASHAALRHLRFMLRCPSPIDSQGPSRIATRTMAALRPCIALNPRIGLARRSSVCRL